MKIKVQTRKLAAGCSKHCFEVVDRTDEVSSKHGFEVTEIVLPRKAAEIAEKRKAGKNSK
ncbi:N-ethylammeline chlorohydrolase [Streptococcus pneumoniae]|nr:N-ethylammeline chlorohydrolase [Streptococcus pneumoniae]